MNASLLRLLNGAEGAGLLRAIFRSPVFQCGRQGLHDHQQVEHVLVKNNIYEISVEHPYLGQDDAEIWQMALRSVRQDSNDGTRARVTWNQWCRALRRPESHGSTNSAIKRSLERLRSTIITVRAPGEEGFRFHMVKEVWKDDSDASWISIDADLGLMLDCDALDSTLEHRTALASQLARWLHAYCVCGSRKTETVDIDKLRVMCGAEHYPLRVFKDRLKKAIKELTLETKVVGSDEAIPPVLTGQTKVEKATVHLVTSKQAIDEPISQKLVDAGVARLMHTIDLDAPALPFNARRRVFVVTTSSTVSDGYIDFQSRMARFGNTIDGVVRMKPAKRDQDNTRHLAGAILKLIETHNPGRNDIVAIVRGGGPDEQFTMFDAEVSIDAILALRNKGVYVIAGVGHTRHAWAIDAHVDHAAPVPFAAAEYVNRLLDLANNRPAIEPKRRIFPVRSAVQRHPALA